MRKIVHLSQNVHLSSEEMRVLISSQKDRFRDITTPIRELLHQNHSSTLNGGVSPIDGCPFHTATGRKRKNELATWIDS